MNNEYYLRQELDYLINKFGGLVATQKIVGECCYGYSYAKNTIKNINSPSSRIQEVARLLFILKHSKNYKEHKQYTKHFDNVTTVNHYLRKPLRG